MYAAADQFLRIYNGIKLAEGKRKYASLNLGYKVIGSQPIIDGGAVEKRFRTGQCRPPTCVPTPTTREPADNGVGDGVGAIRGYRRQRC